MNKLTEIREALKVATPGPWNKEGKEIWNRREGYGEGGHVFIGDICNPNNASLIANAPEYISYLLSLLEEKDKALAFYADENNHKSDNSWTTAMQNDFGDIARKALNTSSNSEGE